MGEKKKSSAKKAADKAAKKAAQDKAAQKKSHAKALKAEAKVLEHAAHQLGSQHDSEGLGLDVATAFRAPAGLRSLAEVSTTPGSIGPQDKQAAVTALAELGPSLAGLQERLFAESTAGRGRSVVLLLQGMDTAGKDGVIKAVAGELNPGALRISSFKKPTKEELAHDFLWRIENGLPQIGQIGVFNRSQYEDVLVVRVHDLVPRSEWATRFARINAFERRLARGGTTMVKCFLHISKDTQKERLLARLDDPTKYWKFNPGDVDERELWDDYQAAYVDALRRCSTAGSPWYVIPSDKKWYRNWAVAAVLNQRLTELDPQYPPAQFDISEQRERLAGG